jgi:hypothetical protein
MFTSISVMRRVRIQRGLKMFSVKLHPLSALAILLLLQKTGEVSLPKRKLGKNKMIEIEDRIRKFRLRFQYFGRGTGPSELEHEGQRSLAT